MKQRGVYGPNIKMKMKKTGQWRKEIWSHKHLILLSLFFLAVAIILDYFAGVYVTEAKGVAVPDLILDHIPTVDLDFIFIYGYMLIVAIIFLYPLFFKIRELHEVISQFSLLLMVRAAFTIFTHLQVPTDALIFKAPSLISFITFQNDLFFSGHTAVAFLGFLLFKNDRKIRYFFLVSSMIMGAVVLLMHVHYSIDVLSAFFITYGTFKIGGWILKKIND